MTSLQPGYFQPSGFSGPAAVAPPMMSPVGVIPPSIPFQGSSFPSAMPPTQPFAAAMPAAQQTFPSAMPQAGSYPAAAAASVGSYPAAASSQAVPLQMASATTSAAASQNSVSWCNCLACFYHCLALDGSSFYNGCCSHAACSLIIEAFSGVGG